MYVAYECIIYLVIRQLHKSKPFKCGLTRSRPKQTARFLMDVFGVRCFPGSARKATLLAPRGG